MKFTQFINESKIGGGSKTLKLSTKQKELLKKFAFSKKIKQSVYLSEYVIHNQTDDYKTFEIILKNKGYEVPDKLVWEIAREYDEIPNLTGIYIGLVYMTFGNMLENEYGFDESDYEYNEYGEFSILGEYIDGDDLTVKEIEYIIKEKQNEKKYGK